SDDVNIFFHCGSDDNVELCIYDALGELIHRETLATCCGTFRHTLPADAFRSTGVYLIRCSFDKKSLTRKLLRL
ncbi:MAG: hypothetical protein ACE5DN_02110, partial [Flavobacteriales bacterium]